MMLTRVGPAGSETLDVPNCFSAVGNLVRVRLYSYCRDQLAVNVLHYRVSQASSIGTTTDVQIANGINNLFRDKMADAMSRNAFYYGCDVQMIEPVLLLASHTTTPQRDGQDDDNVLPLQTAGIIHKASLLGGRQNMGRMYVPFPSQSTVDTDHKPAADYLARLGLIASAVAQTGIFVVNGTDAIAAIGIIYHRADPDATPPRPSGYTFIDGCGAVRKFAVQRRRGDYGRQNPLPW